MNLKFIQVYSDNNELCETLYPAWLDYMTELETEDGELDELFGVTIKEDFARRVRNQGTRPDMHLEVCFDGDEMVGFAHFAIVKGTQYGLLGENEGFVMEFYVLPTYRRKGYARTLYSHIETILAAAGARNICLTSNPAAEAFWLAVDFRKTEIIDSDNNQYVFVKEIA